MKRIASLMGALLLSGCAVVVQGAIQISYQIDSGPQIVCANNPISAGPAVCSTVAASPVTIQEISASSNSPGTSGLAEQFGATLEIQTTADTMIHIWMGAQGFTAPTTPPPITYSSSFSTTSTLGTTTADLTSCVDGANGLTPPTTAFCGTPEASLTNTTEHLSGASSQSNTVSEVVSSLTTTPYSLEQEITLSLQAGSQVNIITSQILTPVPEPASLLLFGSLLGAGLIFHRKLQSKRG